MNDERLLKMLGKESFLLFKEFELKNNIRLYADQPERSKREDSEDGAKCDSGTLKSEMRCSEHDGNIVTKVQ